MVRQTQQTQTFLRSYTTIDAVGDISSWLLRSLGLADNNQLYTMIDNDIKCVAGLFACITATKIYYELSNDVVYPLWINVCPILKLINLW